jgi:hypothetical protein
MALPTLSVDSGAANAWTITITAEATGLPVEGYTGSEVLAADVWPGDDRPALFHPSMSWVDATAAKVLLTILPAQTAALAPGRYQVRASITPGDGHLRVFFAAWLDVKGSPGTATARPTYGTADEMLRLAPWLTTLQAETDQSNFAEALADAREWLDGIILERWAGLYAAGDFLRRQDTFQWTTPGDVAPAPWMRDALAAGGLIVRPAVTRICALYAIAEACEPQLGKAEGTSYQALGRRKRYQAEQLVRSLRAEVDTNADGVADYVINLGSFRLR